MTENKEESREKGAKGKQHYKLFRCAACGREQKRYKSTKKCNCGGGLIRLQEPIGVKELKELSVTLTAEELEATIKDRTSPDAAHPGDLQLLRKALQPDVVCFHPLCNKTEVMECRGCGLYWCGDHMVRSRSGTHSSLYCRPCDQPYRVWSSVIALYLKQMLDALGEKPK